MKYFTMLRNARSPIFSERIRMHYEITNAPGGVQVHIVFRMQCDAMQCNDALQWKPNGDAAHGTRPATDAAFPFGDRVDLGPTCLG